MPKYCIGVEILPKRGENALGSYDNVLDPLSFIGAGRMLTTLSAAGYKPQVEVYDESLVRPFASGDIRGMYAEIRVDTGKKPLSEKILRALFCD